MVDAILAEPENYQEIRAELLAEGVPADLLPVEFDAAFFGALNMALDQMSGMQQPMAVGPEGFSDGGIAQLSPIASGLAQMGRNGDTMLAHITPSEARMLRRRGGSGTINPVTGLPEFFLKKVAKVVGSAFKSVGNAITGAVKGIAGAVKKFASSTIGKVVTTIALGFFLGPAAASFLGVAGGSALGAGISGFVGGFGASLLGGGNLKSALKTGALAGVTAGAGAYASGADFYSAATMSPAEALAGQVTTAKEGITSLVDKFSPSSPAPVPSTAVPSTAVPSPGDYASTTDYQALAAPSSSSGMIVPGETPLPAGMQLKTAPTASTFTANAPQAAATQAAAQTAGTTAAQTAATPSAFQEIVNAGKAAASGNYGDALSSLGSAAFGTVPRTVATGLGGLYLTGGFTPDVSERPGIVPTETGYDLLRQNPEIYATNPGGAESVYANVPGQNPFTRTIQAPSFTLRPPVYPSFTSQQPMYAANGGEMRKFAQGGIAALAPRRYNAGGYADGGTSKFPRRTGQIAGPGTEKSDSIPAMLSDGEFVVTAKAVRGAGNGSRREGAKRMYQMMHKLERMA
jgi:hypothetical protein